MTAARYGALPKQWQGTRNKYREIFRILDESSNSNSVCTVLHSPVFWFLWASSRSRRRCVASNNHSFDADGAAERATYVVLAVQQLGKQRNNPEQLWPVTAVSIVGRWMRAITEIIFNPVINIIWDHGCLPDFFPGVSKLGVWETEVPSGSPGAEPRLGSGGKPPKADGTFR